MSGAEKMRRRPDHGAALRETRLRAMSPRSCFGREFELLMLVELRKWVAGPTVALR